MRTTISAQFTDPGTTASYLGEAVGTNYSAALRAAEAYGRYLAPVRDTLLRDSFNGENLRGFWADLMRSEQVDPSPKVLRALGSDPSHYFRDFLETAEEVYGKRYVDVPPGQRKKAGHTEHARCLRLLRDHAEAGLPDHLAVRNKVAAWIQLIRILRLYRE